MPACLMRLTPKPDCNLRITDHCELDTISLRQYGYSNVWINHGMQWFKLNLPDAHCVLVVSSGINSDAGQIIHSLNIHRNNFHIEVPNPMSAFCELVVFVSD